jgi:hypothetical protein
MRGGFILAMFEKLLKLELKKWFKLIADLDLLPVIFGTDWRFIYLQKLTGTVTIVPAAPLWAYFRVISDPDRETMKEYISRGEKATWYKLCRISNHYRIEKLLIECTRVLEKEAAKAGLPTQKEKVSHVNAGVVPDSGSSSIDSRNGKVAAEPAASAASSTAVANCTSSATTKTSSGTSSTSSTSSSHSHSKPHHTAAAKKIHAKFTNQDSSHEHQAAAQRAYFHLNPSSTAASASGAGVDRSPSISPNLRPTSSGDDVEVDPVEGEEAFLAPDVELDHSVTADLLTTMGDADWRRGDDDTDQTDEEYESPMR